MHSSPLRLWGVALLAAPFAKHGVLGQSASITIPPSPTTTGHPFQGFSIIDTTTIPVNCPSGKTYTTSASFAACCASTFTQCDFATACKDNALVFKDATSNCGPLQCQTISIYPAYPADGSVIIEPVCAGVGQVDTLFRAVPMTSQLVLPLAVGDSTPAATAISASAIPTPTGSTMAINGNDASNRSSSPNLIIAIVGAILGTLILVALIFMAFMYGRKHGKSQKGVGNKDLAQPWKSPLDISRRSSSEFEMKPISVNPYVPPRAPPSPSPSQHVGLLSIPRSRFEDRTGSSSSARSLTSSRGYR